jgi:hypothetical protein
MAGARPRIGTPCSFSFLSFSVLSQKAMVVNLANGGGGGATACPFASACVHPRVSALPSKGCAAVPFAPEPETEGRTPRRDLVARHAFFPLDGSESSPPRRLRVTSRAASSDGRWW